MPICIGREGVSEVRDETERGSTLEDHLRRFAIQGNDIILKMDVEGDEFGALGGASDEVLARFEQIVVEVHGLMWLTDDGYRRYFVRLFEKMNRFFTLFHVHASNWDGADTLYSVGGIPVVRDIELSYIRTSRVTVSPSRTLYPTVLDYPNTPGLKDKLLWFYPFLPTGLDTGEFAQCEERLAKQYRTLTPSALEVA